MIPLQSLDNSAAALIPEQYEARPPAHPLAAFNDDHSADTTPVQIQDQQDPKLATPNMELVAGVIKKPNLLQLYPILPLQDLMKLTECTNTINIFCYLYAN